MGDNDLAAAVGGDDAAFDRLVAPYRRELQAHCYRMLGSPHDAEDALQESMLAAWRGLRTFEGRSTLRAWLYRICTNACLRLIDKRPRRLLTPDYGPPFTQTAELGRPVVGPVWLEPLPDGWRTDDVPAGRESDPAARFASRETVELAYVAALQHLSGTQRAVLILRDVLAFSAAETARILDTTPVAVNSALQRAHRTIDDRVRGRSQCEELGKLGDDGIRKLVDEFVAAWERADVNALVSMLSDDAVFTMPPLPAWFDGRAGVAQFVSERLFANAWRLVPIGVNGQLGFVCYMRDVATGRFPLSALNVLSVRDGLVTAINGFVDPALLAGLDLPPELPPENSPAAR